MTIMHEGHIRQKGKSWYYSFETAKINGKRHRIERYGGTTSKEANAALRQALKDYHDGGKKPIDSSMSYNDYLDYWYENFVQKKLKYNTQMNYLNVINKYLKPNLGIYYLKNLNPAMLDEYSQSLLELGLADHTMQIIVSVLKKSIRMAVYPYELIKNDPSSYVSYPKRPESVDDLERRQDDDLKIITLDQFNELMKLTPVGDPFYVPANISFWTGLRRGEVSGLEWNNVDLERQEIHVKQQMIVLSQGRYAITTPKTKNSYRTIPIGQTLVDILKQQRKIQSERKLLYGKNYRESNFVCTQANGKPVTPNSIKYEVQKVRKKVDFDFNFHSFRHTHATMMVSAGANWKDIQKRLGHSRLSTTMNTYAHVTKKQQRKTVDQFEEYIKNQG